jgi:cobalt-zinc-cadmium efflux system outer membrane protein
LLAGCAKVNPRPAFGDLEAKIKERTGRRLAWARSVSETAEIERTVQQLLQDELTVDEAVQIALLNNRSLQAIFEEMGISQADVVQAGLLTNPSLSGFARFPHGAPSAVNTELNVAKDFFDFLILPLRKKVAAAELERTKRHVGSEVLALATEVKTAYYTLQARQQLVGRLKLIVDINEAAAELARRQREAGNLSALDLAQHEAVWNQSKADVAFAEMQARVDRERLNRLLGLWGASTVWSVPDGLPEIPAEEVPLQNLESLAMANRLDVDAGRFNVNLLAYALSLRKKTRFFPLGIHLGVETERDSDTHRVTGPILALELPVFDWGQASVPRLEAQLFQAQRQLEALAINARSEVREARDLLIANRELARYYGSVLLPQRVEILELTLRQYNMMLRGAYDLLIAKQAEVASERAYIDAWRDYWIARAALERALGGSLPAGEPAGESKSSYRGQP